MSNKDAEPLVERAGMCEPSSNTAGSPDSEMTLPQSDDIQDLDRTDGGVGRTYRVLAKALVKESFALDSRRIGTLSCGEIVGPIKRWKTNAQTGQLRLQLPGDRGWTSVVSRDGTELLRLISVGGEGQGVGPDACDSKREQVDESNIGHVGCGATAQVARNDKNGAQQEMVLVEVEADQRHASKEIWKECHPTRGHRDDDATPEYTEIRHATPASSQQPSASELADSEMQDPKVDWGKSPGCRYVRPVAKEAVGSESDEGGSRVADHVATRDALPGPASQGDASTAVQPVQAGRTNRRAIQQPSRYREDADLESTASRGTGGFARRGSARGAAGRGGRGSSVLGSGSNSCVQPPAHLASRHSSVHRDGIEDAADMKTRHPELWSRLPVRTLPRTCWLPKGAASILMTQCSLHAGGFFRASENQFDSLVYC